MTHNSSQSNIFKRVSANITAKILASGMSQNSVADKLGVESGNFSVQLRSGNFRIDRLDSLAEILGCHVGDFFH
jgi:DNA-binding Xre family transcriptional regulator